MINNLSQTRKYLSIFVQKNNLIQHVQETMKTSTFKPIKVICGQSSKQWIYGHTDQQCQYRILRPVK